MLTGKKFPQTSMHCEWFLHVTDRLRSHAKEEIVLAKAFKLRAPYFANVMMENVPTLGLYQNWRNSKENLFNYLILLF